MKIAIIGAGAMGSLFGARLALAGKDVWLLDIWEDHIRAVKTNGLILDTPDRQLIAYPQATTKAEEIGSADLVIVFVKSTATRTAAQAALSLLNPDSAVLTLQNGYGNADELAGILGASRVIAGTTAQGATMLSPGRVRHGGNGETHIGEMAGNISPRLRKIAALLCDADIPTMTHKNVNSLIWGKLIINVGINALTGITGLKNGELLAYDDARELIKLAVWEAVAVAKAAGVDLPYHDPLHKVLTVASTTAQNRSSMLQDLTNGRITEVDAINGAIVREGERLGVATPANKILTLLIKTLEQTALKD